MARTFRRRQPLPAIAELNVIPLIDIAFSMLIIFMIATPLIENQRSMPVDLPLSTQSVTRRPETRFIEVTILNGGYEVDGVRMSAGQFDVHLRQFEASLEPPVISIRADRTVPYQEVMTVLDLLKRHNLNKISLETQMAR